MGLENILWIVATFLAAVVIIIVGISLATVKAFAEEEIDDENTRYP